MATKSRTPMPIFLRFFVPVAFTGALLSGIVAAAVYKTSRALSVILTVLSGLAVAVGVGLQKRKAWALPGTHSLFAFLTLFASLEFLFLGLGATGSDPAAFVDVPASTYGWIIWSVLNVQGVASTITPLILSLLLAVWVPSYVSLRGQRVRAHFDLPALAVTGKPSVVCISLCCLLPLYGFAIPVALYDPNDLPGSVVSFQLFSSFDAWVVLAMTLYGVYAGAELWSCQSGAVRRAERLLAVRFIYSLCFAALLFILAPNTAGWLILGAGRYSFLTGMASGVLYIFLRRSAFCSGANNITDI